jgi:hypothetical protein
MHHRRCFWRLDGGACHRVGHDPHLLQL